MRMIGTNGRFPESSKHRMEQILDLTSLTELGVMFLPESGKGRPGGAVGGGKGLAGLLRSGMQPPGRGPAAIHRNGLARR